MDQEQEQQFNQNPEQSQQGGAAPKKSSKGPIIWTVVVVIILIIAAVLLFLPSSPLNIGGEDGVVSNSGKAVASVNGTSIARDEFEKRFEQTTSNLGNNQSINDEQRAQLAQQIVNSMINQELVIQAAEESGVTVSNNEVEEQVQQTVSQLPEGRTFEGELEAAGLTEAEFRADVRRQILMQKYVNQNTSGANAEVTDAEVEELYNQQVAQVEQQAAETTQIPPLEEVRSQIVQLLRQQKQNEEVNALVEELRADAEIDIMI